MNLARWAADWLLTWRDRALADPSFRRWASRFPIVRTIARGQAVALFDLLAGFVYSQILSSCVRLRLFDVLRQGPVEAAIVAEKTDLDLPAAERLLAAASALRLVERRAGGRFGLGSLGLVLIDNPGLVAMIEHHAMLYHDLADPVALLKGGHEPTQLQRFWAYARHPDPSATTAEKVGDYSSLMAGSLDMIADEILAVYDIKRHKILLDVGGGEGVFIEAVRRQAPDLSCVLFDLPAVVDRAVARLGADDRIRFVGGSFFDDPLPEGADLVTLVRIVHDHDDEAAMRILKAVYAALPSNGTLLLAEPMSAGGQGDRVSDAYFGFYLLAMGSGQARTPSRLTAMLQRCGFHNIRPLANPQPMLVRMLTASKK